MKKLNSSMSNGGVPMYETDILNLQDEAWHGILSPLSMFDSDTQGVAVAGCVATYTGTLAITAGYVYLNGELMYFPGASGVAAPAYIVPDTVVNASRTFKDGTSHVVTITKNAKAATGHGSGQFISIDTDAVVRTYLKALASKITAVNSKVISIGDWNMDSTDTITIAHGLSDFTKIRHVAVEIIEDSGTLTYDLGIVDTGGAIGGGTGQRNSTTITLARTIGGAFDNTNFNATSFNRGYVTIFFEN